MTARVLGLLGSAESAAILSDIETIEHPSAHGTLLIRHGYLNGQEVVVFPRSGPRHPLPAHNIDARENIQILKSYGVTDVISSGMTGSLRTSIPVGSVLVLDQFLDFTRVPRPTFFDDDEFGFVDFSEPFCSRLRGDLVAAFRDIGVPAIPSGCYVGVDGPRFETAAEVRMFAQLGGDVVGCTVLPECVYAREAGLHYATVAGVVNLGAGLQAAPLHAPDWLEMRQEHMASIAAVLDVVTKAMAGSQTEQRGCGCPPIAYERLRDAVEAMSV